MHKLTALLGTPKRTPSDATMRTPIASAASACKCPVYPPITVNSPMSVPMLESMPTVNAGGARRVGVQRFGSPTRVIMTYTR